MKCSACQEHKDEKEFTKNKSRGKYGGLCNLCKPCLSKVNTRPAARLNKTLGRYNLTLDEYKLLVSEADGKCLICDAAGKLVVDHNHTTGKVRGLLCRKCNAGIGLMNDNLDIVRNAYEYLLKHE